MFNDKIRLDRVAHKFNYYDLTRLKINLFKKKAMLNIFDWLGEIGIQRMLSNVIPVLFTVIFERWYRTAGKINFWGIHLQLR